MAQDVQNPVARWDFRISADGVNDVELSALLRLLAKNWVFQLEKGETTGYLHYQGRLSLFKKTRKFTFKKLWEFTAGENGIKFPNYFEPTTNDQYLKNEFCYVMKHQTREKGPWSDKDTGPVYVPRQYRGLMENLYPYQKEIFQSASVFDPRIINMVYCPHGNIGKSTIASLCELHAKGIDLPPVNDAEKLVATACDIVMAMGIRDPSPIFVDLPRSMDKSRLNGIYTAIEQIKKGKLYDLRYKYKQWWIDSPQIWVFSNIEPDLDLLSLDRWRVWTVNKNKELVKYSPPTHTVTNRDELDRVLSKFAVDA